MEFMFLIIFEVIYFKVNYDIILERKIINQVY